MDKPPSAGLFSALDFWSAWLLSKRGGTLFVPRDLMLRTASMLSGIGAVSAAKDLQGLIPGSAAGDGPVPIDTFGPENRVVLDFFLSRQEELPVAGREILAQVSAAFSSHHA